MTADDVNCVEKKCATCPVKLMLESGTEWKTQCSDCFQDERTKRECKICNKKKICITEPSYKDVCGSCYKEAPMKPCATCKQYVLKAFDWRNMCGDCFKTGDFKRPCQECKVRPVAEHLPSYVTSCSRCYLEKKKKTHDACPWCVPAVKKQVTLNKRKEAPGCRKCMESRGMLQLFGKDTFGARMEADDQQMQYMEKKPFLGQHDDIITKGPSEIMVGKADAGEWDRLGGTNKVVVPPGMSTKDIARMFPGLVEGVVESVDLGPRWCGTK
jgi:hypothetical protein